MPEPPGVLRTIPGTGLDAWAPAGALAAAMASGALTSAALTGFYLDRIRLLNTGLHAVIAVSPAAAAEAAASDAARASGAARGPLEGIPVLVKDNIQAAGMPTTAGSPALAEAESADAFLVARLREAGAVILGKANLSEWANFRSSHSTSGWSTTGGQTANPRGAGRNPSGSSSGSAAAVAAGLAPLAVGTETDGSIVCPASACGIVGIKPTTGLVSRAGVVPVSLAQDTAGPMAGSVADAAALLSVLAAVDPAEAVDGDFHDDAERCIADLRALTPDPPARGLLDPAALEGARLGVWRAGSADAGPATAAILDAAVARLRACGATVVDPVELPGAGAIFEPEFTALLHEFRRDLNGYLSGLAGSHPATLAGLIEYNERHAGQVLARFGQEIFQRAEDSRDAADLAGARAAASRLARAALDTPLAGDRLDAIVALTANPAGLTDYVLGDHDVFHTSTPGAVAGYPSVTVPAGQVPVPGGLAVVPGAEPAVPGGQAPGLPVGVSFMGPAWSEPRLIALAHAFEQAIPGAAATAR